MGRRGRSAASSCRTRSARRSPCSTSTTTSLSPTSATAGAAGFSLTVNGTNFISSSVVQWNGVTLTTSYVSATQLTATVPAANVASQGTATVTVVNPPPGGGTSNGQT